VKYLPSLHLLESLSPFGMPRGLVKRSCYVYTCKRRRIKWAWYY